MSLEFTKLQIAVTSAALGMSNDQMLWHPDGKWCTGEVLEHLYLTYTGTLKGFERVRQAEKPLASAPTWKHHFQAFVVTGLGYLPEGRKSPAVALPRGLSAEEVRTGIPAKIAAMDEIISNCEARFGRFTHLLDHPILGPLTGAEWRKFHLVHGMHHVKQIQRLRESAKPEFKVDHG